ncbi:MAG: FecR domain-containing protein [Betaproteobacteria bacterium]|nr:FecR domain-containing protein [Betaproteobacteria bacterium]
MNPLKHVLQRTALALAATLLCQIAWAAAEVSNLTGTAQAIPGAGAPRALKQGDRVNQGETVSTGAGSSIVMTFDDGQIVALTANSRLAINTYSYNKEKPAESNVLLNLASGGMRAITGLIGKAKPSNVAYRAGNATIGIRGTDLEIGADGEDLFVIANDGEAEVESPGTLTGWVPLSGNMFGMPLPLPTDALHLAALRATVNKTTGFVRILGISRRTTPEQVRQLILNSPALANIRRGLTDQQLQQFINNAVSSVRATQRATSGVSLVLTNLGEGTAKVNVPSGSGGGTSTLPSCSTISPVTAQNPGGNCRP